MSRPSLYLVCLILVSSVVKAQEGNTFYPIADLPGAGRAQGVFFSINNRIYVGLGSTNNEVFLKDFWEYDPASAQWTRKQDFPGIGRALSVATVVNGKAYVGLGGTTFGQSGLNDWWEYDPQLNAWTQKLSYPGDATFGAFCFSIGDLVYVGSGGTPQGTNVTKQFWAYDPQLDTWTRKADFGGSARFFGVGFEIENFGYVGTGYDFISQNFFTNDFWRYDPVADAWERKADVGGGVRSYAAGFSLFSKGYIGGGMGNNYVMRSDVWAYDPETDSWEQQADLPQARSSLIATSTYLRGYFGGGLAGNPNTSELTYSANFWSYVPDGAPSITSPLEVVCSGTTRQVEYSSTTFPFEANNVLTAELSDANGNFANPIIVGSLATTSSSGTLNISFPADLTVGTNYRLRLRSTQPAFIGKPFMNALKISAPDITLSLQKTSNQLTCDGDAADFAVEYSGDVVTPDFEWKKNGNIVGANSNAFHDNLPKEGEVLTCRVIRKSGCTITEKIAGPLTLQVKDLVTPKVSIQSNTEISKICSGITVIFTAVKEQGGSSPQFTWKKNGVVLSETSEVLTTNSLNDDDKIECTMVSNETCVLKSTAESEPIQLNVLPQPPSPIISMEGNTLSSSYKVGTHQWYFNDEAIPGAVSASYKIEQSGAYKVTYIDQCESTSNSFNAIFTGVEQSGESYVVYPNPVNRELIVRVNNSLVREVISIYNYQGRQMLLKMDAIDNHSVGIDFSETQPGIYLVKVGRQVTKISKR
jgi:N-acetylneuraminic acid mutarotase